MDFIISSDHYSKLNKYNKVDELEVLEIFGNTEFIGQWYVPKFIAARLLNTSLYQINKHCKRLIENGYLEKRLEEPFHDYDYESGIDYGNSLRIWITIITDKGVDKLKRLGIYRNKWYEE